MVSILTPYESDRTIGHVNVTVSGRSGPAALGPGAWDPRPGGIKDEE